MFFSQCKRLTHLYFTKCVFSVSQLIKFSKHQSWSKFLLLLPLCCSTQNPVTLRRYPFYVLYTRIHEAKKIERVNTTNFCFIFMRFLCQTILSFIEFNLAVVAELYLVHNVTPHHTIYSYVAMQYLQVHILLYPFVQLSFFLARRFLFGMFNRLHNCFIRGLTNVRHEPK